MNHSTLLSSSSIVGNNVKNHMNEDLGDIKDLMIDTGNGEVRYAVLDFGGFLGIGNKLFAVPMTALSLDKDNDVFILNQTKESLKEAEGFDKDNWPDMVDPTWRSAIDTFYSREHHKSVA